MSAQTPWLEANQAALMAELAVWRLRLEARLADSEPGALLAEAEINWSFAQEALPTPSALDQVCSAFGLTVFERQLLLLAAAPEFDGRWSTLFGRASGDSAQKLPSFGLALALLPEPHWSALVPGGPLRRWRLIEPGPGPLTQAGLSIDERILHHLAGVSRLDSRLGALLRSPEAPRPAGAEAMVLAQRLRVWWADSPRLLIQLRGQPEAVLSLAAQAAETLGRTLQVLSAADLPSQAGERETLARLCEREAWLAGAIFALQGLDSAELTRNALHFADLLDLPVLIVSREPLVAGRPVRSFEPAPAERGSAQAAWAAALGPVSARLNGQISQIASQFSLDPTQMAACAAELESQASAQDTAEALGERLWALCRTSARGRLDELASRIEATPEWDDLVLPAAQKQVLADIAAQVRGRVRVYQDWGFASRGGRGLGISALFAGASGTGKTMAAEVLAHHLRLDLYRIDLSQVVNKYIGETEKNLKRVFDAAEDSGAILLFDEADALFGKRSDVKDSHDRYANVEISYLLQRMEAYRGLAILTTNLKNALDKAFLRRIRFVVQFPFPDASTRAEIWRRVFPALTPVQGLAPERLARLELPGGNIRNIALNAAFYAADQASPVTPAHLLRAARAEFAKLERPLNLGEDGLS